MESYIFVSFKYFSPLEVPDLSWVNYGADEEYVSRLLPTKGPVTLDGNLIFEMMLTYVQQGPKF